MKKIIFAGITALIFSCGMGVASAYSNDQEQAAKKATQASACACTECLCNDCNCQDCTKGKCDQGCCEGGAGCSTQCAKK